MIILAIDPGITGALAFYDPAKKTLVVHDMPTLDGDVNPHSIAEYIRNASPNVAIIEQASPMPKEGVRSVWRFASAFTTVCVATKLQRVPLYLVPPAKWKRAMNLKGGKEGKEQARERAIDAFPGYADNFRLKKDHGRAEAVMLAVYASNLPSIRNCQHDLDLSASQPIIP
jgi:crossover junction endodeoxyribonuclease RuvC